MSVQFFEEDVPAFEFDKTLLTKWLENTIEKEGKETGDVNLVLCSDEHLLEMNKTYLDHDYYTDILTFDYCEDKIVSGDLFISLDRVEDNAKDVSVSTYEELCRVFVHGVLHLCGYKDKSESEQLEMTSKEDFYLALR